MTPQRPDQDFARRRTEGAEGQVPEDPKAAAKRWAEENLPAKFRRDLLPRDPLISQGHPILAVSPDLADGVRLPSDPLFAKSADTVTREQWAKSQRPRRPVPPKPKRPAARGENWSLDEQHERDLFDGFTEDEYYERRAAVDDSLLAEETRLSLPPEADCRWYDDELDDRPTWQRDLDITDADLNADRAAQDTLNQDQEETRASAPLMCSHCHSRPAKYKRTGWCSRCYEYQRDTRHRGQLPPPSVIFRTE